MTIPPGARSGETSRTFDLEVLGSAVRVVVSDSEEATRVRALLAGYPSPFPLRSPDRTLRLDADTEGASDKRVLYADVVAVRRNMAPVDGISALLWQLNQLAMATPGHVLMHAGCVASDGAGLILSGPMEAGKSTLVTYLVLHGFGYLSDELAALSLDDGLLYPVPCPIGLDVGSFDLFPQLRPRLPSKFADPMRWHLPSTDLRPDAPSGPVVPTAVLFPRYSPESECVLELVSPKDALLLLIEQTFNLDRVGRAGFLALTDLLRHVPAYSLAFCDAPDAYQAIHDLISETMR